MSKICKILLPCLILVLLFSAALNALALDFGSVEVGKAAKDAGFDPGTTETTFAETTGTIIAIVLSFTGVIFLVLMVYAGWLWMTARGEEEPVEKAQKIIISSIIGLIILVGAYSITTFVVPRLTDVTGKDEGENIICCQVCVTGGGSVECTYAPTSGELCKASCGVDEIGCETDTKKLDTKSGIECSVKNFGG